MKNFGVILNSFEDVKKVKTIAVHSGNFHLDELAAIAMFQWLLQITKNESSITIKRLERASNDYGADISGLDPESTLLVDVGNGMYDHHDAAIDRFVDKYKMCAFELLARDIIKILDMDEEVRSILNDVLVDKERPELKWWDMRNANDWLKSVCKPISNTDNHGQEEYPNTLAYTVFLFSRAVNPDFDKALSLVSDVMKPIFDDLVSTDTVRKYSKVDVVYYNRRNNEFRAMYPIHGKDVIICDVETYGFLPSKYAPKGCKVVCNLNDSKGKCTVTILDTNAINLANINRNYPAFAEECNPTFIHPNGFLGIFGDEKTCMKCLEFIMCELGESVPAAD